MENQADPKALEVVKTYFSSLQKGDLETLGRLFDDEVVWHQPGSGILSGVYKGKAQVFSLFGQFMEISNGTFKIDQVSQLMVNGAVVAANLRFSASRDGDSISMAGIDVMRIENGKIKEVYLFSSDQAAEDQFWNGK